MDRFTCCPPPLPKWVLLGMVRKMVGLGHLSLPLGRMTEPIQHFYSSTAEREGVQGAEFCGRQGLFTTTQPLPT